MLGIARGFQEVHCFGSAQFLGQFLKMLYDRRIRGDVTSGNHVARIRMGNDLAVSVHDEDDTVAHAGVADSRKQTINRDDGSKHPRELSAGR